LLYLIAEIKLINNKKINVVGASGKSTFAIDLPHTLNSKYAEVDT